MLCPAPQLRPGTPPRRAPSIMHGEAVSLLSSFYPMYDAVEDVDESTKYSFDLSVTYTAASCDKICNGPIQS